jgi:hypothetical protein
MARLFGTDGVRGIANTELSCDLAFRLGQASAYVLASDVHRPTILVGRDTRLSGEMLESALVAGICSVGARAVLVEVLPTPAIAYLTRFYEADAGAVISASHNTVEYNGIKFFDKNGLQATVPYTEQYTSEASWFAPGEGKFFDHNGKLLLKKLLCDTIYQVDTKKHLLVPAYHIDFGKWPSKETLRYSYKSIEELQNRLFTEMPFVSFLGEGSDYLVFTVTFTDMVKQQMMHSTNFYNFQNKSTRSVMLTLSDEDLKILGEDGDPLPDYMKGISNNYFFPQVMSDDGNSLISWRQQTNDQNPAVIIATLK